MQPANQRAAARHPPSILDDIDDLRLRPWITSPFVCLPARPARPAQARFQELPRRHPCSIACYARRLPVIGPCHWTTIPVWPSSAAAPRHPAGPATPLRNARSSVPTGDQLHEIFRACLASASALASALACPWSLPLARYLTLSTWICRYSSRRLPPTGRRLHAVCFHLRPDPAVAWSG